MLNVCRWSILMALPTFRMGNFSLRILFVAAKDIGLVTKVFAIIVNCEHSPKNRQHINRWPIKQFLFVFFFYSRHIGYSMLIWWDVRMMMMIFSRVKRKSGDSPTYKLAAISDSLRRNNASHDCTQSALITYNNNCANDSWMAKLIMKHNEDVTTHSIIPNKSPAPASRQSFLLPHTRTETIHAGE